MATYDVIVAGLGAAGSASASHLAGLGQRVLGLDRFSPPHALGSSHGGTRIIREAYFEGSAYVPLVRRAYELWHELERESGETLLAQTGGITIGRPGGALFQGALTSAMEHAIPHETLSSAELARRYPDLRPDDDMSGILETRAGVLFPEACIAALLGQARARGSVVQAGEPVLDWSATSSGVTVQTPRETYSAGTLVLAAGPWLPELLGEDGPSLWVERQVMHWFGSRERPGGVRTRAPITLWEYEPDRVLYTIPDFGSGTKAAFHHAGEPSQADDVRRSVDQAEIAAIEQIVGRHMPGLIPKVQRSATCMYTNTPDQHFLIDRHSEHPNVIIVSACSGHGFKFAPAVGEIVAGLVAGSSDGPPALFARRAPMS